jgi:hypothetical protein
MSFLREQLPPAFFKDPLQSNAFLRSEPASKTLLPQLFEKADHPIAKSDYFLIAAQMKKDEIPAEVVEKLDLINKMMQRKFKGMLDLGLGGAT